MQRASVVVVVVVVVAVGGEPLHCTGSRAGRVFAVWSCRGQAFAFPPAFGEMEWLEGGFWEGAVGGNGDLEFH